MTVEVHDTASEEETEALAEKLARRLPGGSVVHLSGELGAGKTCFARGLARGVGIPEEQVVSPTFTLVALHGAGPGGPPRFVHVDLYRILCSGDLAELGLDELPGPEGLAALEWPERLEGRASPGYASVTLEDLGGDRRRIRIALPPTGTPPPGRIL